MKNIFYLLLVGLFVSCQTKNVEISPDSLYNVDIQWEQQDGERVTFSDFQGKVLVTAMIFTSCKTACPILTGEMKGIYQRVGKVDPDKIQYMLISIDPETDTPEVMKAYLNSNDFTGKEWVFIRGTEEETRQIANLMAVKYKEISPVDFSHSNIISVYDKKGVLAYQKEGLDSNSDEIVSEIKKQLKL